MVNTQYKTDSIQEFRISIDENIIIIKFQNFIDSALSNWLLAIDSANSLQK